MDKQRDVFYRITTLVTARDLQHTLAISFDRHDNAFDAYLTLATAHLEPTERFSLILNESNTIGWWWPYDEDLEQGSNSQVEKYMRPLPLSMLVSSNTAFFDLAECFARRPQHPFFFVIDGAEITGTVSYLDLFSRLGQICILSLTFDLETAAEALCLLQPDDCWNALSPNRRKSATELFEKKYGNRRWVHVSSGLERLRFLMRCTMLADKGTMLAKVGLVNSCSKTKLRSVFSVSERIRNLCAHGGTDQEINLVLPQRRFAEFYHQTQDLIESIRLKAQEIEST